MRVCCCTDAVVAHDLGNDAADIFQAFSSLENRRTERGGKVVQKSALKVSFGYT